MNTAEAKKIVAALRDAVMGLVDGETSVAGSRGEGAAVAAESRGGGETPRADAGVRAPDVYPRPAHALDDDFEALYRRIKERLIEDGKVDPILIALATSSPELVVQFEPRVVKLNANDGVRGRTARLIADGFFSESKAVSAVRAELKRQGNDPGGGGTLYDVLKNFARDGFLLVENDRYLAAPGLRVTREELVAV